MQEQPLVAPVHESDYMEEARLSMHQYAGQTELAGKENLSVPVSSQAKPRGTAREITARLTPNIVKVNLFSPVLMF